MKPDAHDLIQRHMAGLLTEDEAADMQTRLKADTDLRRLYLHYMNLDVALGSHAESRAAVKEMLVSHHIKPSRSFRWLQWRPLTAAAAGVVLGAFSAAAWAFAGTRIVATVSSVMQFRNGGFEEGSGPLPTGRTTTFSAWRGGPVEITSADAITAKEGRQVLRFMRGAASSGGSPERAGACDAWQIVDLRPLRELLMRENAVLELSAAFADTRPAPGVPYYFACHLLVFEGVPGAVPAMWWPDAKEDALASAKSRCMAMNDASTPQWQTLSTKLVLPPNADYAVVRLVVHRQGPPSATPAEFGEQFVDDVKLVLKTEPPLPVRLVQR